MQFQHDRVFRLIYKSVFLCFCLATPYAFSMSLVHFPNLMFVASCRKICCCLLPLFFSDICVVTAAVAWLFHTQTLEKKKVAERN